MAKAKNLQWGSANRPKISNKLGVPIPVEGSDGDIQVRQTNAGPKLFAKLGGVWNNMFLSRETDVLSIRDNKGVSRISLSATGDADFHGTLKITGYGGMIDFQGGQGNVLLGDSSAKPLTNLVNSSTNDDNIAMGSYSMYSAVNARHNICLGYGTMQYIGRSSSEPYADNSYNVAIGLQALAGKAGGSRTQAARNVAIGLQAMFNAHYDDSASSTTYNNVVIGFQAGYYISGYSNVLIGDSAGKGVAATTGFENVGIGDVALNSYTTGYRNVALGVRALEHVTSGNLNTGVGINAGQEITEGHYNTFVGSLAGDTLVDGDSNICIGYASDVSASDSTGQVAIGNSVTCTADNTTVIGNTSIILDAETVSIESTDSTDTTHYPILDLYRNADVQDIGVNSTYGKIGEINFYGQDSGGNKTKYGFIRLQIGDDADGSEDGKLLLGVIDGGSEAVVLNINNDRLGISQLVPSYKLDVYTDESTTFVAQFQNDGNNADRHGIRIQCGADDGSGTTYFLGAYDGDGGNTGFLKTVSGTFSLADVSDVRLKKDIVDTSVKGLDSINAIKVRDFKWKKNNELVTAGFIASELKEICPHIVDGELDDLNEDGSIKPMTISRELLVPVLTKAVQELSAKVDAMQIEINNLK